MQGTLIGNYRVVRQLAEGGMGAVYIGRHETLGRPVAMKVLLPEMSCNADMVQRFFNEAQAATAIRNPGIVQVFDFGTTPDGRAFIVMELLEGQTLTARLKQRKLEVAECCRIGRQIANVLQAAHERGITHRDLKPDNLFLVPDAEVIGGERVKVLDFGIAKLASELHAVGVRTAIDVVMGTPSYMSPEQCRGAVSAEPRSDIYSLGCILFEMTCGRPPFVGRGLGEIIGAHLYNPPPHPQSFAPEIPPALAQLIVHLLAKQPHDRPQTMAAVSQSLDEILRALSEPARRAPAPVRELASTLPFGHAAMPAFAPDPKQASGSAPAPAPPHALATVALSAYSGPPPSAYAPMPPPIPQPSPISTTISGSAGASVTSPSTTRRRIPLVFGGLAVAGVAAALVIVLAVQGSPPQEPEPPPAAVSGHEGAATTEAPRVCIADALADKGQEQLAAGQLAASLASYEAAYNCRPAPEWAEKAFVITCNLNNLPKAKRYWKRLSTEMQSRDLGICVRNRITEDMLNGP